MLLKNTPPLAVCFLMRKKIDKTCGESAEKVQALLYNSQSVGKVVLTV